jgi:hypothetical protein
LMPINNRHPQTGSRSQTRECPLSRNNRPQERSWPQQCNQPATGTDRVH